MQASLTAGLVDRMMRAARLDERLYEEVENDRSATAQAAIVVVATSLAGGIGAIVNGGLGGLVFGVVFGLLGWVGYAYIAYFIGTRLLAVPGTTADWGEVARPLGFANSPGVLLILGVIPILGALIALIVGLWILVTTVVALRAALDFSTGRAIVVAVLAWLAQVVLFAIGSALT
jgi:hypothetical protein